MLSPLCSSSTLRKAGTHNHRPTWLNAGYPQLICLSRMYYVYFLASRRHGTLYIGVTNSLHKRLKEHRNGEGSSFVKAHSVFRLVYVESYDRVEEAITREKQLKRWKRDWKIELIERDNPEWRDVSDLLV